MRRECETCIKRKTPYCPTSIDCMATDDMPYYQNRIMLLEENESLKKQLEENKTTYLFRLDSVVTAYKNQQQDFIEYLENEININPYDISDYNYEDIINTILSKYKEIIGVSDEK